MNQPVLDRSYKRGYLTIEIHRIPTAHGHRLSVSAWGGDFYKKQDCSRWEFGDGTKFLREFEASAEQEYEKHLKQRELTMAQTHHIDHYIDAARQHCEDSEPDHEVGDLQGYLRAMWDLLTPQQQAQFHRDERVLETLEGATGERGEDRAPGR